MKFLDMSSFAPCLHGTFSVDVGGGGEVPMTLVRITKLKPKAYPGMVREPFSLTFKCENKVIFPQKLYRMRNAHLGEMNIFVVPTGRDYTGIFYDALFN